MARRSRRSAANDYKVCRYCERRCAGPVCERVFRVLCRRALRDRAPRPLSALLLPICPPAPDCPRRNDCGGRPVLRNGRHHQRRRCCGRLVVSGDGRAGRRRRRHDCIRAWTIGRRPSNPYTTGGITSNDRPRFERHQISASGKRRWASRKPVRPTWSFFVWQQAHRPRRPILTANARDAVVSLSWLGSDRATGSPVYYGTRPSAKQ